jgi:hypothetical protein
MPLKLSVGLSRKVGLRGPAVHQEALKIIAAFVIVGLITTCISGNALILLPILLAV